MKDMWLIAGSVLFAASLLVLLWFQWREGRDERGRHIMSRTFGVAYGVLAAGVLLLVCAADWSQPYLFASYTLKDCVFLLLCLSGVAAGATLLSLRARL